MNLQDVIEYAEETYNEYISVYEYGSFVRVTNGSAGMYADIHVDDGTLKVGAERYGETYRETFPATMDNLQTALSESLGL